MGFKVISLTDGEEVRFWMSVKSSIEGCWNWTKCTTQFGHGTFCKNYKSYLSHRISWTIHFGAIPEGLFVLHKCDNPRCIRPSHLYLGTFSDNSKDMVKRGRGKKQFGKGSKHPGAKLKEDDVREILALCKSGLTHEEIAEKFRCLRTIVTRIANRKIWSHVV